MDMTIQKDLEKRLQDKAFVEEYGESIAKAEVAVAISEARRSQNITQEGLAEILNTSQSYIAKLEGGDANPTIGKVGKILASMGLRLMAGFGQLSSRIEEKGVWFHSVDANEVVMTWTVDFGGQQVGIETAEGAKAGGSMIGTSQLQTYNPLRMITPAMSHTSSEEMDFNVLWRASPNNYEEESIAGGIKE